MMPRVSATITASVRSWTPSFSWMLRRWPCSTFGAIDDPADFRVAQPLGGEAEDLNLPFR
jgi:hypothetical protein